MTTHETIRQLLALSAAGLLDAADERRVREHVASAPSARRLSTIWPRLRRFVPLARAIAPPTCWPAPKRAWPRSWRLKPASATAHSWPWPRACCLMAALLPGASTAFSPAAPAGWRGWY